MAFPPTIGLIIILLAVLQLTEVSATKHGKKRGRRLQTPVDPPFEPATKDPTCEKDMPYRWPNDKICHIGMLVPDEGCSADKPFMCMDGECFAQQCPKFLQRCDSSHKRYSCYSGDCVRDEKACLLLGNKDLKKNESPKYKKTCSDPSLY